MSDGAHLLNIDNVDARAFSVGQPVMLSPDPDQPGGWRYATRWDRLRVWFGDLWRSATSRFRTRRVVANVDLRAGAITIASERWSWRRWRWERVA